MLISKSTHRPLKFLKGLQGMPSPGDDDPPIDWDHVGDIGRVLDVRKQMEASMWNRL
ncbi:hypothetical protein SV7mr_25870 [Stieleria bergensis]|uniref:Uncharacterized protein n=1 Tax=Stieleria bergensis TaxID=2528025 RepID=A0A517SVD4_9BACT|nr:hypothetical protein SV7mr_25870 [Planctomycetes bacterium SV_7m_r]